MEKYDPDTTPAPDQWNQLDEDERLILIEQYHKKAKIRMPNHRLHAAIHCAVENQAALGEELPVKRTLERLISEGLDRHDAVHAIGSVLAEHLHGILKDKPVVADHSAYFDRLLKLNAQLWRQSGQGKTCDRKEGEAEGF